ncbi:ATP phosphoribosyltransferase regulatory subunit [Amphibiibacter pelophylacis]|uniref:ATP phosphoribosyltransferase regulatory subunit n=1 Tax=Amphibiibacter pelophylacis TaxID=1799477 RepID=A0ACC6P2H6_9BURK
MTSAWLLPEHLADVLPIEARQVETLRRLLLDTARLYGFELVMPPMLEHLDAMLQGGAASLNLKTFKVVDQKSGRTLALRSDATPQAARIDAHLLNRDGVVRLCYCGPVLHALPDEPASSREALQFGAELFGHAGLEADLEILDLTLHCARELGLQGTVLDLADARLLRALLELHAAQGGTPLSASRQDALAQALAHKDLSTLEQLSSAWPRTLRQPLLALLDLYGEIGQDGPRPLLERARVALPDHPLIRAALSDLADLADHLRRTHPGQRLSLDLSDMGSSGYYTGVRFALFAPGCNRSLLRGGRYDAIGAAFGRERPAVGFSVDVKALVDVAQRPQRQQAVLAPWHPDAALRQAVQQLRAEGQTVVCALPGHAPQTDEFDLTGQLAHQGGQWRVVPLAP